MTDLIERAKTALEGATPGPWTAHNMVHADRGDQMTPEEIGEYVSNAVKRGDTSRFLFVSGKHEDGGDCDVCQTGNGPKGPHNTALIALAPDLARLAVAAGELAEVAQWLVDSSQLESCHDYEDGKDPLSTVRDAIARFRAIAEGKE